MSLQIFLYLLGLVTTVLAIFYTKEAQAAETATLLQAAEAGAGEDPTGPDSTDETPLGYIVILAPFLATIVSTIRIRMRPREKWATCLMAANQIVDQIYRYRLRTDPYDTSKNPPSKDGDEPIVIPPKQREINARKEFIDTCTKIYSAAISAEVAKNGALKMGTMAMLETSTNSDERKLFQMMLKDHVEGKLLGKKISKLRGAPAMKTRPAKYAIVPASDELMKNALDLKTSQTGKASKKAKKGIIQKQADALDAMVSGKIEDALDKVNEIADKAVEAVTEATGGGVEESDDDVDDTLGVKKSGGKDDYMSQMSIESYVEARLRPYTAFLERRARILARQALIFEHVSMFANTSSAVMAVLGLASYVAISVAISSVALALLDYFYMLAQLGYTNRALEEAHNALLYWDSLSLVQRKKVSVKRKMANLMEGNVLALCSIRTGISAELPNEADDATAEAE